MMHVAYVCADPGVPVFGSKGCSVHVQEVLRALVRTGARVTLLAARLGGDRTGDLASVELRMIPRLVPQHDPGFRTAVTNLAAAVHESLAGLDDVNLIYERHSLWSFSAMEAGRRAGTPTCLEVNAPLILEQQRYRTLLHPELAVECVNRACTAADTMIAVSRGVAKHLEAIPGARGRVHVVHNGVDVRRFVPNCVPALERRPGALTIGFAGSLKPWHGVEGLVEAFALHHARHARSRLIIIGDGPEREAVRDAIDRLGLAACVVVTGAVSPAEMPSWLASLDVAVAPYPSLPDAYFSPLKIFEYLAAGVCTVATRIGDIPELIENGVTGILCPPGDAAALASVFDDLAADPTVAARIGRAGRTAAAGHHTWDGVVRTTLLLALGAGAAGRGA